MRRTTILSLLCFALLVPSLAQGAQVYLLAADESAPEGRSDFVLREAPGMRLLLLDDGAAPVTVGQRLRWDGAEELFLVEAHADFGSLPGDARILHRAGELALVAVPDAGRSLDGLEFCRERVAWLPRSAMPTPIVAKRADPQVEADIVAAVDLARFSEIMRELSGDLSYWLNGSLETTDNRYTYTAGSGGDIDIAAAYLEDRFEAAGYPVIRQSFNVGSATTDNVIAVKTGTLFPDEVIVVGAHYDSISENPMVTAPGAEDNGSGTAAVLHLAEIFAGYSTERTVHFVCFSGEEQGLYGSQYYVSQLGANGWTVTNSLTMDMIASWETNYEVIIEGQLAWEPLMSLFESNVLDHTSLGYRKDYFSFGSDHVPFQQAGIPCFLAIDLDYDAYDHYHRTTDLYQYTDPTLGWNILRAMAGSVVDLTNPVPIDTDVPAPRSVLALEQNAPNPFNPTTLIRFSVPTSGAVSLEIFDLAGRRVQTVVSAELEAGDHVGQWDGTDLNGRTVSSGTYLYRLEHADGVLSRRMVLTK